MMITAADQQGDEFAASELAEILVQAAPLAGHRVELRDGAGDRPYRFRVSTGAEIDPAAAVGEEMDARCQLGKAGCLVELWDDFHRADPFGLPLLSRGQPGR